MKPFFHILYWLAIIAAFFFGNMFCHSPCPPVLTDTIHVVSHGSVIDTAPVAVQTVAVRKHRNAKSTTVSPDTTSRYFLDDFVLPDEDSTACDSIRLYSNSLTNDTLSITSKSLVYGKMLHNEITYDLRMPVIYNSTTSVVPRRFMVFGAVSTTLQSDLYLGGGVMWKRVVVQYGYGGTSRHLVGVGVRVW